MRAASCYNASTRSSGPGRRQQRSAFTTTAHLSCARFEELFATHQSEPLYWGPGRRFSSETCEHNREQAVLTKGD